MRKIYSVIKRLINNHESYGIIESEGNRFLGSTYQQISAWHDIPLLNNGVYNMCVEIPNREIKKFEMSKTLKFNPIIQDKKTKNGVEFKRYLKIPYTGINYGFLPQTWEDNSKIILEGMKGDGDPIDVIEISNCNSFIGEIMEIKIAGAICLIDQGEVDWKILAINNNFLTSNKISAEDYLKAYIKNEQLNRLLNKLKIYKTLDGKKENTLYKTLFSAKEAVNTIEEAHKDYLNSIKKN